jgi:HIRAN domain
MMFSMAIVGARFRPPAAGLLSVLPQGFPLRVQREPTNAHDGNAIAVHLHNIGAFAMLDEKVLNEHLVGFGMVRGDVMRMLRDGPVHLGYIPREDAKMLAGPLDDAGGSALARFGFATNGLPRVKFELAEGTHDAL